MKPSRQNERIIKQNERANGKGKPSKQASRQPKRANSKGKQPDCAHSKTGINASPPQKA